MCFCVSVQKKMKALKKVNVKNKTVKNIWKMTFNYQVYSSVKICNNKKKENLSKFNV